MNKQVRAVIFSVLLNSSAWAFAGLFTFSPFTALPMADYVPMNILPALIIGGGIASVSYMLTLERTLRDLKLLASLAGIWAVGWVIGSIVFLMPISHYLLEFLWHNAGWYPITPPLPKEVLLEVVAALPRYAVVGGAISGLAVGIGLWLTTRRFRRLSWLLIAAAIVGWAVGWWVLARTYSDFALDFVTELLGLGAAFWLSRSAVAGAVAGISTGFLIPLLPRRRREALPAEISSRNASGEEA